MENETLDNLEATFGKDESDVTPLSDTEIFTKIWTSPRVVFKYINAKNYDKYVVLLLVLYGIHSGLNNSMEKNAGNSMSFFSALAISVIGGGLLGWIVIYFFSALLSWTGGWLNGQGKTSTLARTFAYGSIPASVSLILIVPRLLVYKEYIFKLNEYAAQSSASSVLILSMAAIDLILALWSFVISIVGIAETQKFSIGKTLLNFLLAFLVVFIPALLIIFGFKALN